jgi:hypothetical protein
MGIKAMKKVNKKDRHWHFEHIGDMSTFPSFTKIIVGSGLRDAMLPGYKQTRSRSCWNLMMSTLLPHHFIVKPG